MCPMPPTIRFISHTSYGVGMHRKQYGKCTFDDARRAPRAVRRFAGTPEPWKMGADPIKETDAMSYGKLIEYADASPEARAVMDEIKTARGVPDVNNAWKAMARHPDVMRRFWQHAQAV